MEAQEMAVAILITATTLLRRTHAQATIVKSLINGNDQKYNEATHTAFSTVRSFLEFIEESVYLYS
jgi:hypothetical protein